MKQIMDVVQIQTGQFRFIRPDENSGPAEVFLMKKEDGAEKEFLVGGEDRELEAFIPGIDYRPYFLVKEGSQEYVTAERTLPVEGMNNFRDMGGYETDDGRHVRWGRLYRSGHFYSATDAGLAYLRKLGLHTIIDYRSVDESDKYPNRQVAPEIQTFQFDPEAHTAELSAQFTSSKENEDLNLVNKITAQKRLGKLNGQYDIVMEQYRNFVELEKCRKTFGEMLRIAARPETAPLVQHCRGGKDRTGFGSMLLLGVLGVKQEWLLYDYMQTEKNRLERNRQKLEIYRQYTDDEDVLGYLYSLIETKQEFIETSLKLIEEKYGSIGDYARNILGMDDRTILSLQENYLV